MSLFHRTLLFAVSGVGLIAAGCTVGPNYQRPTDPASAWQPTTAPTTQSSTVVTDEGPAARWWSSFNDPQLDRLIDRGLNSSFDLAIAQSRVREARTQLVLVRGRDLPEINAGGSFTENRFAGPLGAVETGDYNFYQAGFDASWEIDVFGGTRRAEQAAEASLQAGVQEVRNARLTLMAEIARNYIELRAAQRRLQIATGNLQTQEHTLALTRERLHAGIVSDLDVSRAAQLVANTRATLPLLRDQASAAMRRIGVLVGEEPDALVSELTPSAAIPQPPQRVAIGLPAQLLRRRPDVQAAERRVAAAVARIGVATADLYPKFAINGEIGTFAVDSAEDFGNFDNRYFGIGPAFRWNLFNAGQTRARINAEQARAEGALAGYRRTVLVALAEAKTALDSFQSEQERRAALADAVVAGRRAVETATAQYRQGVIDFLSVLDAERSLAVAEDALAQSDQAIATDLVALYKAIGGGPDQNVSVVQR